MDEAGFIAALRTMPLHGGARGLADDCAVITLGSETLVLTHDAMAQGVHYLADADMADVAWKLVASNLSDLAAKGAEPIGILLGHVLGHDDARFLEGLAEVCAHYNVPLLGGDTIAAGAQVLGCTAIGRASHIPVPSRAGAQAGDGLWITGELGAAMLGHEALTGGAQHPSPCDSSAFRRPLARLAEGQALAPLASAMMDISDGLLLDAFRMAEASDCSLAIDSTAVPVAAPDRRMDCLIWGDDYELLFTLPSGTQPPVPATRIGMAEPRGFAPLFVDGEPVVSAAGLGYRHKR